MFENVLKGMKHGKVGKGAKVQKWKAWGNKELNKMKKEGSVQSMIRIPKKKKAKAY